MDFILVPTSKLSTMKVNVPRLRALGGQAGDTKLGLKCIEHWLGGGGSGSNSSAAGGFEWDLIHVREIFA